MVDELLTTPSLAPGTPDSPDLPTVPVPLTWVLDDP